MSHIKISIIIPVYKVEKYISQCLSSVLSQDIPREDYEIIIVNDESPDNSLKIAEEYASQSNNIQILSQRNSGLSAARNAGLEIAQGDYVWFVDSDDYIANNCLSEITDVCLSQNLDGLKIKRAKCENQGCIYLNHTLLNGIVTGKQCLMQKKTFNPSSCYTIFKRSFLNEYNLRFSVGKVHEDVEFTTMSYFYMERLAFLDRFVYYHRVNPTSIMHVPTLKRSIDLLDLADSLFVFTHNSNDNAIRPYMNRYIAFAVNGSMRNALNLNDESQGKVLIKLQNMKHLLNTYLGAPDWPLKIEGSLMKVCPSKSLTIFRLLSMFWDIKRKRK